MTGSTALDVSIGKKIIFATRVMPQLRTVHTSRTIMFSELTKVMHYGISQGSFTESFTDNVAGKRSKSNQAKTNRYLKQLYSFDVNESAFKSFTWFWNLVPEEEQPLVTLLFAIRNDYLLAESIDVVHNTPIGGKTAIHFFIDNLESLHPNRFSPSTILSVAQNLASSWKQAGFIEGKVKNIRRQPAVGLWSVTFALLLGYLEGMRGEFLLGSKYIGALGLSSQKVKDLTLEAAKRDLVQYQASGHIITIIMSNLLRKIGIDGI